jgi:predicted nucleotidyltransferase component of viral defense system
MVKASSKSIRASLLNLAQKENLVFQFVIIRYFQERLLYRISISEYVGNFFLKGGALIYALEGIHIRPTMDIDLLAKKVKNDKESIKQIFINICSIKYEDDCVNFDTGSIVVTDIREKDRYSGVRVLINTGFDTIKQRMQIDLGFSDVITPAPISLEYPVLLEELDIPKIKAYSIETVIAEKFHAMITLGNINSRMKDFYDVYILLKNNAINEQTLQVAIKETFRIRNTVFDTNSVIFDESYFESKQKQIMWSSFLRKNNLESIDFKVVGNFILNKLCTADRRISACPCKTPQG